MRRSPGPGSGTCDEAHFANPPCAFAWKHERRRHRLKINLPARFRRIAAVLVPVGLIPPARAESTEGPEMLREPPRARSTRSRGDQGRPNPPREAKEAKPRRHTEPPQEPAAQGEGRRVEPGLPAETGGPPGAPVAGAQPHQSSLRSSSKGEAAAGAERGPNYQRNRHRTSRRTRPRS